MTARSALERIAGAGVIEVDGVFERHTSMRVRSLTGSAGGGRWGPRRAYSVLYLGRPSDSVVVEAYRHLVDADLDGMMAASMVGPRRLYTVNVRVGRILDLTNPDNLDAVGLTEADLRSEVGDYDRCHAVGRAAHQLELGGILAPAATQLGFTLAVFETHLRATDRLEVVSESVWERLPADPRVPDSHRNRSS